MVPRIGTTIIKLAVMSLIVGMVLSFFEIHPRMLLENFGETAQEIFAIAASFIEWAVPYVLIGAVVVIPIWVIFAVLGYARGRKAR
jgi:hypothetical protein